MADVLQERAAGRIQQLDRFRDFLRSIKGTDLTVPRGQLVRFGLKIEFQSNGCIFWTGAKISHGYGSFRPTRVHCLAHRWAYEAVYGEIPKGLVVDHLCRMPACVNPIHLQAVTMGENTARGLLYPFRALRASVQTHCKRGHEFTPENTRIDSDGNRCCKTCQRIKAEEWKINNRSRVNQLQNIRRARVSGILD